MTELSDRLNTPISTKELERRWKAVRAAMKAAKIDALLMQNNNDHMGGYVKYFTDLPATNGYPKTVVFPRDDDMTLVCQGPFGLVIEPGAKGNGIHRGIKQVLTTPSYASAHYTTAYDADLAATALKPYAKGTIGLVGAYQMSAGLVDHLRKGVLAGAKFVDATDLVDRIKIIKSPEEQALVRRTAAMQDGAMRAAFAAIEPGMRDYEVAAIAQDWSQRHGSEKGIYLCASAPQDQPAVFGQQHVPEPRDPRGRLLHAAGRGQRAGRHVHRARPHLRGRQGVQSSQGRVRVHPGGAALHARPVEAGHAVKDRLGRVQRVHARQQAAGGGAALLPRPGLRPRRAPAGAPRRAAAHRGRHEHRRAPDLRASRDHVAGCATTGSSARTAPASASTASRRRSRSWGDWSSTRRSDRAERPQGRGDIRRGAFDPHAVGSRPCATLPVAPAQAPTRPRIASIRPTSG